MAKSQSSDIEGAKRLMAALGRLPPKQHKDMKLGKAKPKVAPDASPKRLRGRPRKNPAK